MRLCGANDPDEFRNPVPLYDAGRSYPSGGADLLPAARASETTPVRTAPHLVLQGAVAPRLAEGRDSFATYCASGQGAWRNALPDLHNVLPQSSGAPVLSGAVGGPTFGTLVPPRRSRPGLIARSAQTQVPGVRTPQDPELVNLLPGATQPENLVERVRVLLPHYDDPSALVVWLPAQVGERE